MWSNAFYQTVDLRLPDPSRVAFRYAGFGIRRIVAHASGEWALVLEDGEHFDVELRYAWIAAAGHLAGIDWRGREEPRRISCGLYCLDPAQDTWRRLLVRLRVPMPTRLS